MEFIMLILSFLTAVILTPLVKKLAHKVGAVDKPNERKVHTRIMPRIGGLSVYLSFTLWLVVFQPDSLILWTVVAGGTLIMIVGFLDDLWELPAWAKLIGQIIASLIVVSGGIQIEFINLPFGSSIEFGMWSVPLTIIWIVAITNAINLIDGLDGLAAGVSAIALLTISGLAISMGDAFVAMVGLLLFGSTLGFLIYNFFPAKIFLGDTGSLFLGFMISILAILGFKNITVFSIVVPIIILGVPLADTFFAIVRRIVQNKPVHAPDKLHLHHCLIGLGFSHRTTVLIIYAISSIFALSAVIFSTATMWTSIILLVALSILLELLVEVTGLIGKRYRPLLNIFKAPER
ncbi:glycosyltransferase family 4 protein [Virgibacillus kekensis]|uniref:Glycosyltransferase family 4 protein n=1 Tax=Virgibacillus kekensis TaxID=202261 RepID=A0ABV9DI27_9BACI